MSEVSAPEGLRSPCCAQSCPLKVSSLLKGLHCIRSSKWLRKERRAQLCFSLSGCWTAHLSGVGSSWSEEEVSDMIRYWILCLGAKAISFPQFINTNNFRLAKGINLKRYYSIPVRCKLLATFKTKKIQAI